jgi:hypothetical protein
VGRWLDVAKLSNVEVDDRFAVLQFDSNSDGLSMMMRSQGTWKVSGSGNPRISLK